jgi:pimeloyl-ACP methyl ester carboxylesterase/CheY-like chemotaxis protein/uncharacterized membrane protein YgcG
MSVVSAMSGAGSSLGLGQASSGERVLQVETLTPNEVVSCLYSKSAPEKCRIGLADAVLYEEGAPARWYVTGKTGEILKKKKADLPVISERWLRIADQNESQTVAIIRQPGVLKFLNAEAWKTFLNDKSPERSILSVHCFVKGNSNSVFRNKFQLQDHLGRFTTSTHSYNFAREKKIGEKTPVALEPVMVVRESSCTFTESRASSIKNIMDLATNTVVRYLEMMLGIKVLSISIDYIVDSKSQLWMLWTSEAQFVRATSLADVIIPGLHHGDKVGRMSWAGAKYHDEVKNNARSPGRSPSPQRSSSRGASRGDSRGSRGGGGGGGGGRRKLRSRGLSISDDERSAVSADSRGKVDPERAAMQISAAAATLEEGFAPGKGSQPKRSRGGGIGTSKFNVVETENKLSTDAFPDPFKCKGDYCRVRLEGIGALHTPSRDKIQVPERFFTEKEIRVLRKNKNFSHMMEFGADGPALAVIAFKSIVQARKENRLVSESGVDTNSWNTYPESPRGSLGSLGFGEPENKELRAEQDKQALLARDKDQRDQFTKSMADYYKEVRVCGVCYNIYKLLDWARDTVGAGDAYGAGLEGKGAAFPGSNTFSSRAAGNASSNASLDGTTASLGSSVDASHPPSRGRSAGRDRSRVMNPDALSQPSVTSLSPTSNSPSTSPMGRGRKKKTTEELKKNKRTWKDYQQTAKGAKDSAQFADLDQYLRSGADELAKRKSKEKETYIKKRLEQLKNESELFDEDKAKIVQEDKRAPGVYGGKVLLACEDTVHAQEAKMILEEAFFDVQLSKDGRQAVNDFMMREGNNRFDCILVQRDLPLGDAFDIVLSIRDREKSERRMAAKQAAKEGKGIQPYTRRYPIIVYTDKTTPEDLKLYMKADMDGCVSFPVNKISLLNTVRAAVPHHLAMIETPEPPPPPKGATAYRLGALGELEGSNDSATMAAKSLAIAQNDADFAYNGVVQIDADTRVPYTVLDASRNSSLPVNPNRPFFNLIVCHDLFDTAERFKIFLRPIVQKYIGLQVLLWNCPGQAFTEWRTEQLLNNEYLANCLNEVLGQVGEKGTNDFDTRKPFYIMGFGNGTSIATFYASHYRVPNLRGLISFNGWAFLDSYLAGVMHDCANIFECSPPSRPDLPVYFFSRFLFCKDYLAKVSVPLALNIYTAVHNPISITGRMNLCKGVMGAVDVRPLLKEIDCPIICIQSTQDSFARPLHTDAFVSYRGGEVRSIYKVLREPHKTCVVWVKGGHEVFQENRKHAQLLIEQILTGFFETHDITFPPAPVVDKSAAEQGMLISNIPGEKGKKLGNTVEDKFIDNVLGNMNKVSAASVSSLGSLSPSNKSKASAFPATNGPSGSERRSNSPTGRADSPGRSVIFSASDPGVWAEYSQSVADTALLGKSLSSTSKSSKKKKRDEGVSNLVMDPTTTAFERQDSKVYGPASGKTHVSDFPEVKEYMAWRLKRNKKRLQRLQGAARIIQGGFRAYMARVFVRNIKRQKAARIIQRCFRGWIGRCAFLDQARRIWASQMIQRAWRGYLGRKWFFAYRLRIVAAANIQRMFRGHRGRKFVAGVRLIRHKAASVVQALFRRYKARKDAFAKRMQRNMAVVIQRVYRGHLGRRRAGAERDKYIFSRSQSQGIEFGRQMLLEHKLHATKLQSSVTLLTQEKVAAEEQVEALLEEISSFEEGVRTLEKEMHQLTRVEAESAAYMDEESRYALRDQKMKLDKEFAEMLGKIGNRKDMLFDLEKKLSAIDKARQVKEEELRTLERKLVVLLEEQQNELNAIKRKQDVRGAMLAASHQEIMKATQGIPGGQSGGGNEQALVVGGGGGGGGGGPSLQEKKQAAQLMQSTETLMKFGFMSMSMTYFSSLNMIKALRTVSAQDTVMAALADVHAQRAVGHGGGGGGGGAVFGGGGGSGGGGGGGGGGAGFLPDLKPGQLGGQEALRVSHWSVEDVSKWLQTLSLGQYTEAFIDAAIDGEFLYDLNDDDLKNTLGIEHRLHRKKILNSVHRLKVAEAQKDSRLNNLLKETGSMEPPDVPPDEDPIGTFPENPFAGPGEQPLPGQDRRHMDGPSVTIAELVSYVRHSKFSLIKEALDYLPNKPFDKTLVQVAYVNDFGSVYVDGYERLPFHVNKSDDFGNTMLSLACQNGNIKVAKYLVSKGANPSHQNKQGQSPAHFAIAYKVRREWNNLPKMILKHSPTFLSPFTTTQNKSFSTWRPGCLKTAPTTKLSTRTGSRPTTAWAEETTTMRGETEMGA